MPAWEREVPSLGPEFGLAALNVDVMRTNHPHD